MMEPFDTTDFIVASQAVHFDQFALAFDFTSSPLVAVHSFAATVLLISSPHSSSC